MLGAGYALRRVSPSPSPAPSCMPGEEGFRCWLLVRGRSHVDRDFQPFSVLVSLLPAPQNGSGPVGTPPPGYNRGRRAPCVCVSPCFLLPIPLVSGVRGVCVWGGSLKLRLGLISKIEAAFPKFIEFPPVTASAVSPQGSSTGQRAAGELRGGTPRRGPPGDTRERCPVLPLTPSTAFNLFYYLFLPARGPEGVGERRHPRPLPPGGHETDACVAPLFFLTDFGLAAPDPELGPGAPRGLDVGALLSPWT